MLTLTPQHETETPTAAQHARRLLRSQGLPVREVVEVDVDSILYVNWLGAARTAWLRSSGGAGRVVCDEAGFQAEPPFALEP